MRRALTNRFCAGVATADLIEVSGVTGYVQQSEHAHDGPHNRRRQHGADPNAKVYKSDIREARILEEQARQAQPLKEGENLLPVAAGKASSGE